MSDNIIISIKLHGILCILSLFLKKKFALILQETFLYSTILYNLPDQMIQLVSIK